MDGRQASSGELTAKKAFARANYKPKPFKSDSAASIAIAKAIARPKTTAVASRTSLHKPLTEQQKAFVAFWAHGESIANAFFRAGYSRSGGTTPAYVMSKMPAIINAYQKEKEKYETASQMTRKKVMDGLVEAVDMARMLADPQAMIAGWREVGKMCGYYEPSRLQLEINHTGQVLLKNVNNMTDAQLLEAIQAGAGAGTGVDETPLLTDQTQE